MIINKSDFIIDSVKEKMVNEHNKRIEKEQRQSDIAFSIADYHMEQVAIDNKIEKVYQEAPSKIFKYIIGKLYKESLVLDDYFVKENASSFENYAQWYVDEKKIFEYLQANPKRITLLEKLNNICKEHASRIVERLRTALENNDISVDNIDFTITDEDKEAINSDLSKLSTDEISELVKQKVTKVVLDEKKVAMKQEEQIKKVEEEILEDNDTEEEIQAATDKVETTADGAELECSFFSSLMKKAYREYLESTSVSMEAKDKTSTDGEIEFKDEDKEPEEKQDDVMDKITAEAVSEYTMYELMNTMKLEHINPVELRDLAFNNAVK